MAKKQRSYIVSRTADALLGFMSEVEKRTKGAVIDVLVAAAATKQGLRINYVALVDPEREYPVTYQCNQKGERTAPPASGKMLGVDLTAPQIKHLYEEGLI